MNGSINRKKNLIIANEILKNYKICDYCFGRFFKKFCKNKSNEKIGLELRKNINVKKKIETKNCWLCSGLLNEFDKFINLIINSLKDYEFETFLVGSIVDKKIIKKEYELIEKYKLEHFESIKNELNRRIGLILEKKLSKKVDFNDPTIMIIIDTQFDIINLQIKSLYISGRYNKFKRGIPQTKWFCRVCRGIGCKSCNYSGKLYKYSVEELIAEPTILITKGDAELFHGAGREDIDVKMLGNGRPFVLEIKNPKKRLIDLKSLKNLINNKNINKIQVKYLNFSNKHKIKRIKNYNYKKLYRVEFFCKKNINIEKLKKASISLRDEIISQYTPTRVAQRRANLYRDRKIYNVDIESVHKKEATLIIETQSGTYIKELITGDNGKTKPNISELIGYPCTVKKLDVIRIKE